jgi:hypothetical protein
MDEMMKAIIQAAMVDAMSKTGAKKEPDELQEAKKLAKTNKILFDAHIEAGFTAEQATAIVAALNN